MHDIAGCDRMPACSRDYCLVAMRTTGDCGLLPIIRVRRGGRWCTTAPMLEALQPHAAGIRAPVVGEVLWVVMFPGESVEHFTLDIVIVTGKRWDVLESRCMHQHVADDTAAVLRSPR